MSSTQRIGHRHRRRSSRDDQAAPVRPPMHRRSRSSATGGPRHIIVNPIPVMNDFWGQPFRRWLDAADLQTAIGRLLQNNGPFHDSLSILAGHPVAPEAVVAANVALFQEGAYQYVFRVRTTLPGKKRLQIGLLVAKNDGEASRTAREEYRNLAQLHGRFPGWCVHPLTAAHLSIPKPGGSRPNRVFCYFTEWLPSHHELGIQENLNFYINEMPFYAFDRGDTDQIKERILECLFSAYDPAARTALAPPQIGSGDFVITRPRRNHPLDLRLIACRRINRKITLYGCLKLYLGYNGRWGEKTFHFLPRDPKRLASAITTGLVVHNGLAEEAVMAALKQYEALLATRSRFQADGVWSPLARIRQVIGIGHSVLHSK